MSHRKSQNSSFRSEEPEVINLLSHSVNIILEDGGEFVIEGSKQGFKPFQPHFHDKVIKGFPFPVRQKVFERNISLPPPAKGKFYIVNGTAAHLYRDIRQDLLYPAGHPNDGSIIDHELHKTVAVRKLRFPNILARKVA